MEQENNLNEILAVDENVSIQENVDSDEVLLKNIANAILIIGAISSLVLLFTIGIIITGKYDFERDVIFNMTGFVISVLTFVLSLALWAFLRVVSNISIKLSKLVSSDEKNT